MAHIMIAEHSVPGTDTTIRIVRNTSVAYGDMGSVLVEVSGRYGVTGSYGRSTVTEARTTANNHWSYVVNNRNLSAIRKVA
jgi:hypothetical protein